MTDPKPNNGNQPELLVLGCGDDGKPCAARFPTAQANLVGKAAKLMGLTVVKGATPALADLVKKLPVGRLYANGTGFVPPVRRDYYAKLLEAAGLSDLAGAGNGGTGGKNSPPGSSGPPDQAAVPAPGLPKDWDGIEVGHLVIAQCSLDEGWWEAIVTKKEGDLLTVKWRDYPEYDPFVRHRYSVALIKPTAA